MLSDKVRAPGDKEFNFTRKDFELLAQMVKDLTGIILSDRKYDMAYGRIVRRLRHFGLKNASDYLTKLKKPGGDAELINLVNAITTNLTAFYREEHHFELLAKVVREEWIPDMENGKRNRFRVWSAGCSSGEEPYSLTATIDNALAARPSTDALVLATDIDTNMLATGENGIYPLESLKKASFPERYYDVEGDKGVMKQRLKKRLRFRQLNLLTKWPMAGPFDVIFCRNVLIYFEPAVRQKLVRRYTEMLVPGGLLCLGHSESLTADGLGLESLGRTAFRKPLDYKMPASTGIGT